MQDAGVGAFDSFSAMADGGGYGGLAIVPPMGGGPLEGAGALGGGYGVGEEGGFEAAGHAEVRVTSARLSEGALEGVLVWKG